MIRSMEEFTFATGMDLKISCYRIELGNNDQMLHEIVFPWNIGRYKYKRLPMDVKIALKFFKCHV
jgi:hypothetical protein